MTYEAAREAAFIKASKLTTDQLLDMYEKAGSISNDLDAKWLVKDAAISNLLARHEDALNAYMRDLEETGDFVTVEGLRKAIKGS